MNTAIIYRVLRAQHNHDLKVEINRGDQTPRHENYTGGGRYYDCSRSGRGEGKQMLVVADDTDIFVLLFHFCCLGDIPASTPT